MERIYNDPLVELLHIILRRIAPARRPAVRLRPVLEPHFHAGDVVVRRALGDGREGVALDRVVVERDLRPAGPAYGDAGGLENRREAVLLDDRGGPVPESTGDSQPRTN